MTAATIERHRKMIPNTPGPRLHDVSGRNTNADTVQPQAEWVLASKYEELTGVTREAVKQRKKSGVWKEGLQVAVIARRLYVNIKAADQWINDQLPKRHRA